MGHAVDITCFTLKQEIPLCSLVSLIVPLQEVCILTGSVIALTFYLRVGKRLYWSKDFYGSFFLDY